MKFTDPIQIKTFNFIFIFVILFNTAFAQENVIDITEIQIDNIETSQIFSSKTTEYRKGNGEIPGAIHIDTTGWQLLTSDARRSDIQRSVDFMDAWFRVRIVTYDSSYKDAHYLFSRSRGVINVYLDDTLIYKQGEILPGNKFRRARYSDKKEFIPLFLKPGKVYEIKVYIATDFKPAIHQRDKLSDYEPAVPVIVLKTKELQYTRYIDRIFSYTQGIIFAIALLIISLYLLNKKDKELGLMALSVSAPALALILESNNIFIANYLDDWYTPMVVSTLALIWIFLIPILLAQVFSQHIPRYLIVMLIGIVIVNICDTTLALLPPFLFTGLTLAPIIPTIYISWKYRKSIKESKSIIIYGLGATIIFILTYTIITLTQEMVAYFLNIIGLVFMGMILSFPMSLPIYISMRYRDSIRDVQLKSAENLKLTEEKLEAERKQAELMETQNKLLETEVKKRTAELQESLDNLKATQSQLIQSEKMASLGELTAGIAHEIQNPLNFVNNFSEVNAELIEELKAESQKPKADWDESMFKETLDSIKENEQKIVHHGKRADAIVKSMLQHSRTSSGKKELTDLNALCDEYLRLSYHGLRAKDKSFNAKFEIQLDPTLPKVNVMPQDIGRVILNLINNAFYAVSEKSSHTKASDDKYEPTVTVSTKNLGDKIEISVKDNGTGIPENIKEKIFQPFFTTKPTGKGTGLGLSLSYDIISKGHEGNLKVESNEKDGTVFIIILPLK